MEKKSNKFPAIVSSRITPEQKEKIDKIAYDLHLSKSELVRDLLSNVINSLV
jgi:antitoxin component of RelBE/YafQ-DinJ toxin-antitoxin module